MQRPFSADSAWNKPIDQDVDRFSDPTAIENLQFQDPSLANPWVQTQDLLFETPANAPLATWNFDVLNDGGTFSLTGTVDLPTPTNLVITHGGDGWAIFADPDGVHFWETWGAAYNAASGLTALVIWSRAV